MLIVRDINVFSVCNAQHRTLIQNPLKRKTESIYFFFVSGHCEYLHVQRIWWRAPSVQNSHNEIDKSVVMRARCRRRGFIRGIINSVYVCDFDIARS